MVKGLGKNTLEVSKIIYGMGKRVCVVCLCLFKKRLMLIYSFKAHEWLGLNPQTWVKMAVSSTLTWESGQAPSYRNKQTNKQNKKAQYQVTKSILS